MVRLDIRCLCASVGVRKVRNLRAELPSQINDLKFRTEFTKSGALERMGRRESQTAPDAAKPVNRSSGQCPQLWALGRLAKAGEAVSAAVNGGGKEPGIRRSLRSGAGRCGGLRALRRRNLHLRVRELRPTVPLRLEDAALGGQTFVPRRKLLAHRPRPGHGCKRAARTSSTIHSAPAPHS
jgi:hypothetical protein